MKSKEKKSVKFEAAMDRLEQCVERLEDGKVGLEESLKIYEEGMKLVKTLTGKMEDFERSIEIIKGRTEEGFVTESYGKGKDKDGD